MPSATKEVKFKKKLQLNQRDASRETSLCKIKWKRFSLSPLMSSKVEACVSLEAYDSITRGKNARRVLRRNKSQMVCVSVACASPLITKYVKHSCQINTQIRVTGIPDGTKVYYDVLRAFPFIIVQYRCTIRDRCHIFSLHYNFMWH